MQADDARADRTIFPTRAKIMKVLRKQFLLNNMVWVTWLALKKLKHTDTISYYIKDFESLMLDI